MANVGVVPMCKYGANCYRKNGDHLLHFWHPSPAELTTEEVSNSSNRLIEGREYETNCPKEKRSNAPFSQLPDETDGLVEGEWEIDDYDGELQENSESEDILHDPPASSSDADQTRNGSDQSVSVLLVLIGVPGSGKSTFCSKLMSGAAQQWTRICQDTIAKGKRGTRKQCLKQAESAFRRKQSVVIDRCNIDKKQRQDFTQLAARLKVDCHAVVLNLPASLCIQRASRRVAHEGGLHAGNAGPVINRIFRSRQLPNLNEGFVRISFCRTDLDVEKVIQDYKVLDSSKLLEPGIYGSTSKQESIPLEEAGGNQHSRNNIFSTHSSAFTGRKEDQAGVQPVEKQQISEGQSLERATLGKSVNMKLSEPQNQGAKMLAFPSISTADFQFDHEKASTVLIEAVSEFLSNTQNSGLSLVLVDLSSNSHMLSLVRRKASEKGLDTNRFMIFAGDITKMLSSGGPQCNVIANASNWRLKPGGGGVNAAIYRAAGPELEQATKKVATTLLPGTSIVVPVSASSPLHKEEGVTHVIHVLGPNMNPQRPNCLGGDYVKGCKILKSSYANLFQNFVSVSQTKHILKNPEESRDDTGSMKNEKPKLNAFQVLMSASKRKGDVGDLTSKREKGEKVRVVEDGVSCSGETHIEGAQSHGTPQSYGQSKLPPQGSPISNGSTDPGGSVLRNNAGAHVQAINQQGRKRVEKKWGSWALALYELALNPNEHDSATLQILDDAVVVRDLYPKAKKHVLVVTRRQGLDSLEDARQEHLPLLEKMHIIGHTWAASLIKDDSSLVFRIGYHSVPSMRQLHLHVVSQDFESSCLKNKKHWNSFTTPFFRDSLDIIHELRSHGRVDNCGTSAEKMLQDLELRCHRCRSVQPNMPRLKAHVSTCKQPFSNSTHLVTVDTLISS